MQAAKRATPFSNSKQAASDKGMRRNPRRPCGLRLKSVTALLLGLLDGSTSRCASRRAFIVFWPATQTCFIMLQAPRPRAQADFPRAVAVPAATGFEQQRARIVHSCHCAFFSRMVGKRDSHLFIVVNVVLHPFCPQSAKSPLSENVQYLG